MKIAGRVRIYCNKMLPNGVIEMFSVVVPISKKAEVIQHYKDRGYNVE